MQTVKINAGFSEKTSENYNSTQHSISLEMDIQVNVCTLVILSNWPYSFVTSIIFCASFNTVSFLNLPRF